MQSATSTGWWELDRFRRLIGAENVTYDQFKNLNKKIIAPSVSEINKSSDIFIEAEFQKEGRKITAI